MLPRGRAYGGFLRLAAAQCGTHPKEPACASSVRVCARRNSRFATRPLARSRGGIDMPMPF